MVKYFRGIGVICLISFTSGAISSLAILGNVIQTAGYNTMTVFLLILIAALCLLVGPATGLLFISHANLLEDYERLSIASYRKEYSQIKKPLKENNDINTNEMPIEIEEAKEDPEIVKKESSSQVVHISKVEINNGIIRVGDFSCNMKFISETKIAGAIVSFIFCGKTFKIQCDDKDSASKIYNTLESNREKE